jgi:hypothetical protein
MRFADSELDYKSTGAPSADVYQCPSVLAMRSRLCEAVACRS